MNAKEFFETYHSHGGTPVDIMEAYAAHKVREFGEEMCKLECDDCEDGNHLAYKDPDGLWCHADTQSGDVCECTAHRIRAALAEREKQ